MGCEKHELMAKDHPDGYYSECIEKAKRFAGERGYTVDSGELPEGVMGRIYYGTGGEDGDTKRIVIDTPCAGCALMTLLHEIGHMLVKNKADELLNRSRNSGFVVHVDKEILANVAGYSAGHELGFDLDKEWAGGYDLIGVCFG